MSDSVSTVGDLLVILIPDRHQVNWAGLAGLIGTAVVADRPIILVCPPGFPVPDRVARVVDRFVEYVEDDDARSMAVSLAVHSLGFGGNCTCDRCERVRAEAESMRESS
jgi:hypothetical protein